MTFTPSRHLPSILEGSGNLVNKTSANGLNLIPITSCGESLHITQGDFHIIGGPCTIESKSQILSLAFALKAAGVRILRGGAFKPRTSPYSFQGLREEGLEFLLNAKKETGLAVITEIMEISHLDLFENIDIIQVGSRNMQNFELLKELGKTKKPVLLKRGPSSTIKEFLLSAEYIMKEGNPNILLCEKGIRTFEPATRTTLDLSSVPIIKNETGLPVFVDPSHGTGIANLVEPLSIAATAIGADGLMVEVHENPADALCDGLQSLNLEEFQNLKSSVEKILPNAYTLRR